MDILLDEIESLEAILMDDVRINKNSETGFPEIIETTVFPAVDYDSEEQYICVDLQVIPSSGYPDVSPKFNLVKPRGLDDSRLEAIKLACVEKLKESQGFPVVFDLIEVVREHLSGSNLPCGQCVVCLYGFGDGDEFTKTECFHYLHSYCLARHLIAARKNHHEEQEKLPAWIRKASEPFKACCPVCREPIKDDSESLRLALPPQELLNAPEFKLTDDLVNLQKKMTNLFIQQKNRGGIIDIEAEVGSVISIEPTDVATAEEQEPKQNGIEESKNFLKDDRLQVDQKPKSIGETSVRNQKSGTQNRKSNQSNNVGNRSEATASTNFAPVVSQSQRIASDPTNNNYHHHHSNRRHFRGRRSHHHNQHQQQQQQRSENASHPRPISPSTAGQTSSQSNSKQHKGLVANCNATTR